MSLPDGKILYFAFISVFILRKVEIFSGSSEVFNGYLHNYTVAAWTPSLLPRDLCCNLTSPAKCCGVLFLFLLLPCILWRMEIMQLIYWLKGHVIFIHLLITFICRFIRISKHENIVSVDFVEYTPTIQSILFITFRTIYWFMCFLHISLLLTVRISVPYILYLSLASA